MHPIISRLLNALSRNKKAEESPAPKKREFIDPLDYRARTGSWADEDKVKAAFNPVPLSAFPIAEASTGDQIVFHNGKAMDSSELKGIALAGRTVAMDDSTGACGTISGSQMGAYTVPDQIANWYVSQTFIGYQQCALLAQHWLIDKACSMSGEDAIRNGWEIKARGEGEALDDKSLRQVKEADEKFKLTEQMTQLNRFKNVFGIRVLIFIVESEDPKYYEKPFNADGITPGSYKGISQVDPYWMMPMMTAESTADPASEHFYEPEYWIISGKRYHRSHLIIARGPEPADLLKPTYIFGGIPLTQRIYERVYAAERIANEAPLLATNKRTTVVHVDMEKAITNQKSFEERMMTWIKYRDNHAVKVLGQEEKMEQQDTSLADFDSVIMNQYQLVAAIAKTPATKLLGTSPKGFNATGQFETISYHEELESLQKHVFSPFLERHYLLLSRSLGITVDIIHVWEPVDSVTMEQRAELNSKLAATDKTLIDTGIISPDEARNRVRDDKHSGYNRLQDDDAESKPGMSPDNLVKFEQAQAGQEKAEAATMTAGARETIAEKKPGEAPEAGAATEAAIPYGRGPVRTQPTAIGSEAASEAPIVSALKELRARMEALEDAYLPDGHDSASTFDLQAGKRSVQPGVRGTTQAGVAGSSNVLGQQVGGKLPKIKLHGMVMDIENPRGTIRQGMDITGSTWQQKMPHHYGYIRGTKGADGDAMDCFVGPNPESRKVFVVNQNVDGEFDEHKCMIGFNTADEAKAAYHGSYSADWKGFDSIVPMSIDQFKSWLKDGDCYSPLSAACIAQTTSLPMTDKAKAMDKSEFKEADHPRAANGQFGSGGGGAAKSAAEKAAKAEAAAAGKAAKAPGSKKDFLPNMAKEIEKSTGKEPTPVDFHAAAVEAGFDISLVQCTKYLKVYLKEKKAGGAGEKPQEPAAAPAKSEAKPSAQAQAEKPAEKTAAQSKSLAEELAAKEKEAWLSGAGIKKTFAQKSEEFGAAASSAGYHKEGTFNGIIYYKDKAGNKVSYKADDDTWMAKKGTQIAQMGSGMESLKAYVAANPAEKSTSVSSSKAAANAAEQQKVAATHTHTAKSYGDTMDPGKFNFASSGIANEKALPKAVQKSILAYKGSSYKDINNAMRYTESFDPSSVSTETMVNILNLQRAFQMVAPSKNDVTVGRKVGVEALKSMVKDAGIADLAHLKAGDVLRDPGIVSTSHSEHVWSGDVRFEVFLPKGSKVIDISETIKLHQGENEVILGPNSKLKISEVKSGDAAGKYKYHIKCELVD